MALVKWFLFHVDFLGDFYCYGILCSNKDFAAVFWFYQRSIQISMCVCGVGPFHIIDTLGWKQPRIAFFFYLRGTSSVSLLCSDSYVIQFPGFTFGCFVVTRLPQLCR